MGFDERNEAWDGKELRRFELKAAGRKPRVWTVVVKGNSIHTSWGQIGGKQQEAEEKCEGVNVGKSNEKSPEQYAIECARDQARKKNWEGYREVNGKGDLLDEAVEEKIDFDNLPLSLSFYKPDNTMSTGMTTKAEARKVWYTRKRNGLMYVLAKGAKNVQMYSRRMLKSHDDEEGKFTWNDRFPRIVEAADKIMPPNSILLGELVADLEGADDFKTIQSLTKSLTPQSIADQTAIRAGMFPTVKFYIWDIAFWEGKDLVKNTKYAERNAVIEGLKLDGTGVILPPEVFKTTFLTPDAAKRYSIKRGWEGWVVVVPEGVYGEKAYNFKGKPDRPRAFCAKLKPTYEDDFIAIWDPDNDKGERSTKAKVDLGIASVALYQYNKKGELVFISNCGGGLSVEQKTNWADTKRWPKVWKVEYTDRRYESEGDESNALDFAHFMEEREDKKPEECVNERL